MDFGSRLFTFCEWITDHCVPVTVSQKLVPFTQCFTNMGALCKCPSQGDRKRQNAPQPCGCCCPLCSHLPEKGLWVRVEREGAPLITMIYCYWLGCLLLMLPEGKNIFHLSNTFCNSAPFSFQICCLSFFST